jgi:hypothetical protein
MAKSGEIDSIKMHYDLFSKFLTPHNIVDHSKLSEEELLEVLKQSPDFDKLVFPNSWYSKYSLPEKKCSNMKEFLAESPWRKTHQHWYLEKKEIPALPGGLRPILPAPEIPVMTVIQNSFSDAPDATLSESLKEQITNQIVSEDQPDSQKS